MFAHVDRGEHLTRYAAPLWMIAEPAERRGGTQVVVFRGYFAGLPVESVQRMALRPPSSLEFSQVRGTLRVLNGWLTLRAVQDGTDMLFRLEVDAAIPMISEDAAHQFLVQFLERMLDRIKLAAERRAPVRSRSRALAPETVLPGAGEEGEEAEGAEEPALDFRTPETPVIAPSQAEPVSETAPPPPPAVPAPAPPGADRTPQPPQAAPPGSRAGGRHRRRRRRRRRSGGSGSAPSAPR